MAEGKYYIKLLLRKNLMLFMGNSFKGHQVDSFVGIFLSCSNIYWAVHRAARELCFYCRHGVLLQASIMLCRHQKKKKKKLKNLKIMGS